ncbi:hypothetical protein PS918_03141 [Pseudomonas fluorescens]|uniref:Tape measure protein N-terminal domain-containing protein n=1 Tax=Pseudomonas fluorescens TaxID=294 RepID=A0A5E7SVP1_PSEFL|nr:tape measure protein [Pseudomonas fluorescens]VVP90010.1 hypothetical protein PS918_03141 [Pseudomonas fluorescens]
MTETARLVIAVDSTQAKSATAELSNLERSSKNTESAVLRLASSGGLAVTQLSKVQEVGRSAANSVSGLGEALKATAGLLGAAFSVREVAAAADEYANLTNRLRLVTEGAVQLAAAQEAVFSSAQASRQSLETTASVYQRVAQNGKQLGLSFADVASITETIAKSVALSGASAQAAEAALTQFGQALASGALRGDELNSIMEQTPALAQTIARGLGVSVGQLRAMGAEGELTSEKLIKALTGQKAAVDELATTMQVTGSQALTAFGNSLTQAIGKLDEAAGASNKFAGAILSMSLALDGFSSGEFSDFFRDNKQTVAGLNSEIGTTLSRMRDLNTARAKLNPNDAGDTVLFNFKFYNRDELDREIAGLSKRADEARSTIEKMKKDAAGVSGQSPKGEAAGASAVNEAYEKQLKSLQKMAALQGDNTEVAKTRYAIEHGELGKLLPAQEELLLKYAREKDAKAASEAVVKKYGSAAEKAANQEKKALDSLLAQSAISTNSTNAMADAYLAGADNVRELTIQQKVEEELLKTGAGARDAVTAAVNREADAKDRLDISQSIANMRAETTQTLAQATATLQGADALETFNIQKSMSIALSGKKIEYGSKEYEQLLEQTKAQLAANKALEQANSIEGIVDRLNPQVKLLREYTKEQEALNAAIASGSGDTALYQETLAKLALEYEQNRNAATAWGQFTEGAVDRVDDAFADAWKNIDEDFDGFAASLKDGFKQLLAELAHMAITKPIVMQIGASLGVGGLSAQSSGLFGGSGGGGLNLESAWNSVSGAYSVATSGFGSAVGAGWAGGEGLIGGLQGAFTNGASYVSSAISGAFASGATTAASEITAAGLSGAVGQGAGSIAVGIGADAGAGAASYSGAAASAAAGLSATSAITFGIGGAIAGYLKAGVKGAVAGAGGAVAGAYAGAAIGSAVPVIGNVIGAAVGAVLGGMFGSSLFGGDWVTKDQGIQLGVTGGELDASSFEYQKKKGGLFSSNKKRTRLSALDPEMQSALDTTYANTLGTVLGLFDSLNVELSDSVLDGLNMADTKISTKDKTAEQVQEEVTAWFGELGNAAISAVSDATNSGLAGYSLDQLGTFVGNLFSINDTFKLLNVNALPVSVWGGKLAEQFVAMSGGMEAFNTNAKSYYSNFFTETEKADDVLKSVTDQFAALGVTLPASRAGFRALVEGIDSTTDAGRAMYINLIGLNENAASAYTILEQRASAAEQAALDLAQALTDSLVGAASSAHSAVQRAIAAQQKATTEAYNARITSLNDMASTAKESVSGLTSVGNDLGAALKALRGDSDDAVKMLRTQAQATLQSALATARAGGSLSGFTGLSDALDTVGNNNTDLYSSMEDFARDQGRTANVVAELNGLNGKQLTTAEKSLKGLEDQIKQAKDSYDLQMAQFDQQLEFAQAQMDALNGIDNSIVSVADAVKAMNAAVVAALGSIKSATPTNAGTLIDSVYQDLLGHNADAPGKTYWQGQVSNGSLGYDQLAGAIKNAAAENAIKDAYQSVLGKTADAAGAKYWADQVASGALTVGQLEQAIKNAAVANGSIAGHAMGGLISGPGTGTSDSIFARLSNGEYVMKASAVSMFGTGLLDQMNAGQLPAFAMGGGVGEIAPQLEVMAPSRIYSGNQAALTSSSSTTAQLAQKVDTLIDVVKQIMGPMKVDLNKNRKIFEKFDKEGLPPTRATTASAT